MPRNGGEKKIKASVKTEKIPQPKREASVADKLNAGMIRRG